MYGMAFFFVLQEKSVFLFCFVMCVCVYWIFGGGMG